MAANCLIPAIPPKPEALPGRLLRRGRLVRHWPRPSFRSWPACAERRKRGGSGWAAELCRCPDDEKDNKKMNESKKTITYKAKSIYKSCFLFNLIEIVDLLSFPIWRLGSWTSGATAEFDQSRLCTSYGFFVRWCGEKILRSVVKQETKLLGGFMFAEGVKHINACSRYKYYRIDMYCSNLCITTNPCQLFGD